MNEDLTSLVEKIRVISNNYQPSERISTILSGVVCAPIIGPFATGKSTLMNKMEELDENFAYVRGFTTRPIRQGESPSTYNFYPHTEETLTRLLHELENKEIVQIAVHPTNGYVYGSDLDSYIKRYNVLDVLTSAMDELSTLSFERITPVFIVCPAADWHARIKERGLTGTTDEFRQRFAEARSSLKWALEHRDDIAWVENPNGQLENAASKIMRIVTEPHHYQDFSHEQALAEEMLNSIFISE
jgi:guanylate kinase